MSFIRASQGGGGESSLTKVMEYVSNITGSIESLNISGLSSYSKVVIIISTSFQSGASAAYMANWCYINGYSPDAESGMYINSNSSSHLVRTYVINNTFGDTFTITGKWNGYQVFGVK